MKEYAFENQIIYVGAEELVLVRNKYVGGSIAIVTKTKTDSPYATLSVNMPEYKHLLNEDEIFVKTWSENQELAHAALASGFFVDTMRSVKSGFVLVSIWKLVTKKDFMELIGLPDSANCDM